MKIEIFNVKHGHCTVITAPNGKRIMLDCGTRWEDDKFWVPSLHYYGERFEYLIPLNLDEDHLADFGHMLRNCTIGSVMTNASIGPYEFAALKVAGMGPGAKAYAEWLSRAQLAGFGVAPELGAMQVRSYANSYGGVFTKSNDLSVAVIVQFGSFKILFAGDLEGPGWCGLLSDPNFLADLAGVNVFVASHHGRRSGCHEDLFNLMVPNIVVISDDEKQHDTQETHGFYHWRCHGVPVVGAPERKRHVFTTRSDGNMRIDVQNDGRWLITSGVEVKMLPREWPLNPPAQTGGLGLINTASLFPNSASGFGGIGLINRGW